jgi:hypothetical protein
VNRAQRIVVVIALGVVLIAVAGTVTLVMDDGTAGWFAYAPNTGVIFDDASPLADDGDLWRRAGVWAVTAGLWALGSLWVLRDRSKGNL